jgi:hypothetical protein
VPPCSASISWATPSGKRTIPSCGRRGEK